MEGNRLPARVRAGSIAALFTAPLIALLHGQRLVPADDVRSVGAVGAD
jgi:hypothetical protein